MWRHVLDLSGSGHGEVAGSFECGNEPSGSIKCKEMFEFLEDLLASQEGLHSYLVTYIVHSVN